MKRLTILFLSFLVSNLFTLACGGPSAEEKKAFWDAYQALDPIRGKLAAVDAVLPAAGSEVAVSCAPEVATSKLATISHGQLQYLLDKQLEVEQWQRLQFTDESFSRMWNKNQAKAKLAATKVPMSEAAGLRRAAELLEPIEMLAVFRAAQTISGALGERNKVGSRVISKDARWEGWVFIYSFGDKPELKGAFSVVGVNGQEVSRILKRGQGMTEDDLLHDAMRRAHTRGLGQLGIAGCPQ